MAKWIYMLVVLVATQAVAETNRLRQASRSLIEHLELRGSGAAGPVDPRPGRDGRPGPGTRPLIFGLLSARMIAAPRSRGSREDNHGPDQETEGDLRFRA